MKRAYIITGFDLKTDIRMKYHLKDRDIYYTEEDLHDYLKYKLKSIHEEYQDITNSIISYNEFYTKFNLYLKVSVISLNHLTLTDENDYNNYLEKVKIIDKKDLHDYLLDLVDKCEFYYDHNLNLMETYTALMYEDYQPKNHYYKQFAFSYKALFPEKYHVEKFKKGDRVRIKWSGEEYIIYDTYEHDADIYSCNDPLDYRIGYILINDYGDILNDDKYSYFHIDEDLELVED